MNDFQTDPTDSNNPNNQDAQAAESNQSSQVDQNIQPQANGQDFQIETRDDGAIIQSKQIGRYRVEVIRDKCISAASCVAIAPRVFQLDEEGIAVVISQDGHDDDTKLLAAQSCPTAAITVTDTVTGEMVWPIG